MKGFHPTPSKTVDAMVSKLFADRRVSSTSTVLDPGCGDGAFIQGILRWSARRGGKHPRIVGVDSDPKHLPALKQKFRGASSVRIESRDFLAPDPRRFDFVICNPPYVPITGLSEGEKRDYRLRYRTARGRFDLYVLFFEQAMSLLKPGGRMVFITPEKFLYVDSAAELRRMLARVDVEEIHLVDEGTFDGLVTYPTITTVTNRPRSGKVRVVHRDGSARSVVLLDDGASWQAGLRGANPRTWGPTLQDISIRISCGIATGSDGVFVVPTKDVPPSLRRHARPTISGREIETDNPVVKSTRSMLVPYRHPGELFPESEIPDLVAFLRDESRYARLMRRTCASRKPWYAFHETPPLAEMLRPKILCKDIGRKPVFVAEKTGRIVPRHSVYYIVPKHPEMMGRIMRYLNSGPAREWLEANCQRAANGFVRLQSHVLKQLPIPMSLLNGERSKFEAATALSSRQASLPPVEAT